MCDKKQKIDMRFKNNFPHATRTDVFRRVFFPEIKHSSYNVVNSENQQEDKLSDQHEPFEISNHCGDRRKLTLKTLEKMVIKHFTLEKSVELLKLIYCYFLQAR